MGIAYNRQETGKRIRKIRELLGFSKEEMAKRLACSEKRYENIEGGYAEMSLDILLAIVNGFHVSADYILSGREYGDRETEQILEGLDSLTAEKRAAVLEAMKLFFGAEFMESGGKV